MQVSAELNQIRQPVTFDAPERDGVVPGLGDGAMRAKEGIGLTNTRERLAKIYGVHGQLSLRSEPGRGVSVQIILPCRT